MTDAWLDDFLRRVATHDDLPLLDAMQAEISTIPTEALQAWSTAGWVIARLMDEELTRRLRQV